MERTVLLLLACLLLALRTVAQAPEKAAPDDLVVTVEIVGYSSKPKWLIEQTNSQSGIIVFAKMTILNTTDHPRDVFMMNCDWPLSWVASNENKVFDPTFQPACDKNAPTGVTIPKGEALVFECPLFLMDGHLINNGEKDGIMTFKLGFIDTDFECLFTDGCFFDSNKRKSWVLEPDKRMAKANYVYWSNALTNLIDPKTITMIEVTSESPYLTRYLSYHLVEVKR